MNANRFMLFLVLSGIVAIFLLGVKQVNDDYEYRKQLYKDSLTYFNKEKKRHISDSVNLRKTNPLNNSLKFNSSTIPGSFDQPYFSASQGVEAHLVGLEWKGFYFDSEELVKDIKSNFGGRYVNSINQIHLDPDFPECGYPDLFVEINGPPTLYHIGTVSKSLSKILKVDRPVDSYDLETASGNKAKMQLWLVHFDMTFRIEPNDNHSRNEEFTYQGIHPITRERARELRSKREMKNQRYGEMNVLIEFKPKSGSWYIADVGDDNIFSANKVPRIGIAAVECIKVQKVGEEGINNSDRRIGIVENDGKSLPLYPSLEEVKKIIGNGNTTSTNGLIVDKQSQPYLNLVDNDGQSVVLNPDLFDRSKFSFIPIQNLGSWREPKTWFLHETNYNADYFHASFLIHLYIFGEWTVKPDAFTKFELREPYRVTKPGPLDQIFPDFKLGILGKGIGGLLLIIGSVILLSFFFPPVLKLINLILGFFVTKLEQLLRK